MAVIAILSDIPYYIAALAEKLFGADLSAVLDGYNGVIAQIFDAIEKIL